MPKYKKITSFRGQYFFLSNFARSPIVHNGHFYPSAEHLFQTMKATDDEHREYIRTGRDAREAKYRGRLSPLRDDWEQIKDAIMLLVVLAKFNSNPGLAKKLKATGNAILIEENYWHDNYWGNCLCANCENKQPHNMLGRILMRVRRTL